MKRLLFIFLCLALFCACDGTSKPNDTTDTHPVTESDVVIAPDTTEPPPETDTEPITEPVTEAVTDPNAGRIAIPRLVDKTKDEALSLLAEHGITPTISYEESFVAADTVVRIRFHGAMKGDTYYIAPTYPVELILCKGEETTKVTTGTHTEVPVRTFFVDQAEEIDEKTIYLTFDDGPGAMTPDVLATLAKYDAKATFFLVGEFVNYRPQVVRDIAAAGHAIGCHSNSHNYPLIYASAEGMTGEIQAWENAITAALGYIPEQKLFRYPGGSNTSYLAPSKAEELYGAMHGLGYTAFDWTFANNDAYTVNKPKEQPMDEFLKESAVKTLGYLRNYPKRPKIMLMHDTRYDTVATLDWLLNYLTEEGYTFGTLDELEKDWMFH